MTRLLVCCAVRKLVDSAGHLSHQAVFQTLPDSIQLQTHRLLYKHRDMKTYRSSDRWLQLTQTGTSVLRTHIFLYSYEQSNKQSYMYSSNYWSTVYTYEFLHINVVNKMAVVGHRCYIYSDKLQLQKQIHVHLSTCLPNLFYTSWLCSSDTSFFKASQPRGRASGSRACERHKMQGVITKCTRHECSVVNLRPHLWGDTGPSTRCCTEMFLVYIWSMRLP